MSDENPQKATLRSSCLEQLEEVDSPLKSLGNEKSKKNRRRCRRHKKTSSVMPLSEEIAKDSEQKSATPCSEPPRYSKIIFDENGLVCSAIAADCETHLDNVNRKTKKRAGFFDLKSFTRVSEKSNRMPDPPPLLPEITSGTSFESHGEAVVYTSREQNLEVRRYHIPNDYESIVKYWYFNLDQLNRLGWGTAEDRPFTDTVRCGSDQETGDQDQNVEIVHESATTEQKSPEVGTPMEPS
ncbi:unnamed protein product [Calicophoron daubneyi]|uniref:BAH domain-containing protein n=1 Tax=Calicophoron daubneyi TaxID=300641 RepID=A0AAV2TZE6_CALDB